MVSPTECLWHYCGELWILALTIADIISDFLYFEELYDENKVRVPFTPRLPNVSFIFM